MTIEFQAPPLNNELIEEGRLVSVEWEQWLLDLTQLQTEIVSIDVRINPVGVGGNTTAIQSTTILQIVEADGTVITLGADDVLFGAGDTIVKMIRHTHTAGFITLQGIITADNVIDIEFGNVTTTSINPPTSTYTLIVLKG